MQQAGTIEEGHIKIISAKGGQNLANSLGDGL